MTSVIGKVMEALVREVVIEHMMSNDLFCDAQHGFVPGRSCMTQLLLAMELWTEALDRGEPVDVVYMDFQKAFDSVPHQRLLAKLDAYGIGGKLKNWLGSFLTGRSQRVAVNGRVSDWTAVESGIPQGSVLGPILFVLYINDLPDVVGSIAKIYADDTKLFRSVGSEIERQELQSDLNRLVEWSEKWQLKFHAGKCKVLHLGYNNPQEDYSLEGTLLQTTHEEKDLGVVIDEELKFTRHVAEKTKTASMVLNRIQHTFECKDAETITLLFVGLVRPLLEYGNVIWHPRLKMNMRAIENVQRRATRMVPELEGLGYKERLEALKLPSLHHRRRRGDLIQAFKILKGIDRIDPEVFFQAPGREGSRGHTMKLFKPRGRLEARRNVFSVRVVDDWNCLSETVVQARTLEVFKSRLDKWLEREQYDVPFMPDC